jgi:hypothetical protein
MSLQSNDSRACVETSAGPAEKPPAPDGKRPRRALATVELAPVHQELVDRELKARRRLHAGAKKGRIILDCVTKVLGEKYPKVMERHYAEAREI